MNVRDIHGNALGLDTAAEHASNRCVPSSLAATHLRDFSSYRSMHALCLSNAFRPHAHRFWEYICSSLRMNSLARPMELAFRTAKTCMAGS